MKKEIKIGEWYVLPGFERNRVVKVIEIEEQNEIAWVRMPEGDLMDVDFEDIREPGQK